MTTPDDQARLACARAASCSADLKQLLDMLALWPGQEEKRNSALFVPNFNTRNKQTRAAEGRWNLPL